MIKAQAKRQTTARSKRHKTTDPAGTTREAAPKRSKAKAPTRRPAGQRQQTPERGGSKQAQVIAMLQTPQGATIEKIAAVTAWQHHSVRGFFAAVIRKKLGLDLMSEISAKGRVYRIVDRPASLLGSVETKKPV